MANEKTDMLLDRQNEAHFIVHQMAKVVQTHVINTRGSGPWFSIFSYQRQYTTSPFVLQIKWRTSVVNDNKVHEMQFCKLSVLCFCNVHEMQNYLSS
jgi:hypothetical protein